MYDTRLIGETTENIFLSLLISRGIFATSFDTQGLDGVAFDPKKDLFKVGNSPFYLQIKCRGSDTEEYHPQGHSIESIDRIRNLAKRLEVSENSLYFVVGFYRNGDMKSRPSNKALEQTPKLAKNKLN